MIDGRAFGFAASIAVAIFTALVLVACGGGSVDANEPSGSGSLRVVATTTILGDIVENVVCDTATVETLMSPGQDPHAFELSARQAADLRDADLIVANGLGLEAGFADVLVEAAKEDMPVLFVGEEVDPIAFGGGPAVDSSGDADAPDPHIWLDPQRMAAAARLIGERIEAAAPDESQPTCGEDYARELETLDAEMTALLDAIPAERRKLVTNHDSLGYFAERYGFELVGVVIPSGSTLAEPSASDIVELVETIEREGVATIFADSIASAELAETVADETGKEIQIVTLYTGALGEQGSGAESYAALMRTNTERIATALAP